MNIIKKQFGLLTTRDLVVIGIFSAILFMLSMLTKTLTGISPAFYLFCPALYGFMAAPVFLLLTAKVHKTGAFFIPTAIIALIWGMFGGQTLLWSLLLFGSAAEAIASFSLYQRFRYTQAAYILLILGFFTGDIGFLYLFTDWYIATATAGAMGTSQSYILTLVQQAKSQFGFFAFLTTLIAAWAGTLLSRRLLQKHFLKAGLL